MKYAIPLVTALLSSILAAFPLCAQKNFHRHFSVEDGLTHPMVFRVYQDSRGFIWFGTRFGVSRFDGGRFENFSNYQPLRSVQVLAMGESPDSAFWVYDYNGRMHYLKNGTFREYKPLNKSLPSRIVEFHPSSDKEFFFSSRGTFRHLKDSSLFECDPIDFDDRKLLLNYSRMALHASMDGRLFIASEIGLYTYANRRFERQFASILGDNPVFGIADDKKGNLWLGLLGSIVKISPDNTVQWYSAPFMKDRRVNVLRFDQVKERLWFCGEGLELAYIDNSEVKSLAGLIDIQNTQINDVRIDRENNLWLATNSAGVFMIPGSQTQIYTTHDGLVNNSVSSLTKDSRNRLWIGTFGGAHILENGKIRAVTLGLGKHTEQDNAVELVNALGTDSSGNVWAGIDLNHLVKINIDHSDNIKTSFRDLWISRDFHGPVYERISASVKNSQIKLKPFLPFSFYTEPTGLMHLMPIVNTFTLRDDKIQPWDSIPGLQRRRIYSAVRHSSGDLWLATDSGVFRHTGERYRHYSQASGMLSDTTYALCCDKAGRIWGATTAGAWRFARDSVSTFNTSNGLSHNFCTALTTDQLGNVWIGTMNGLNCYTDKGFIHITARRGLASNEVQGLQVGSSNYLWVGTSRGLSRINIRELTATERPAPQVYIAHVRCGDSLIMEPQHITLPYDRADVEINYSAIAHSYPEGLRFQFKMSQYDKDWRETSEWKREYQNLSPGEYTFLVRARMDNSAWSPEAAGITITITPPWWETWWFRSFFIALLLIAAYGLHRVRLERSNRREAQKRRVLQIENKLIGMELRALNLSMSPHFLANALNSIQYYFNTGSNREEANNYLSKFGALIRQILQDAQNDLISLEDELDRLRIYLQLEQIRIGSRLSWSINVDESIDTDLVQLPVMIVQPYVENAIWHGISPLKEPGKVTIDVTLVDEEHLQIEVSDNGIGIQKSLERKSKHADYRPRQGMLFTEERLVLLQKAGKGNVSLEIGELDPDSAHRPGTRVRLIVPLTPIPLDTREDSPA